MKVSFSLGNLARERGDLEAGQALWAESLTIRWALGDRRGIAIALEGSASTASPITAARLWGAAETLRMEIGAPLPPNELARLNQQVASARRALGNDSAFDSALHDGQSTPLEHAVALVLQATEP